MNNSIKTINSISSDQNKINDRLIQIRKSLFKKIIGSPITNPFNWEAVSLGDEFNIEGGKHLRKADFDPNGPYKVYGGNGLLGQHSEYLYKKRKIVIGRVGAYCGNVHISDERSWITKNAFILHIDDSKFQVDFLAQMIRMLGLNKFATGVAQPYLSLRVVKNQIVLKPPLDVQVQLSIYLKQIDELELMFETRDNLLQELEETTK